MGRASIEAPGRARQAPSSAAERAEAIQTVFVAFREQIGYALALSLGSAARVDRIGAGVERLTSRSQRRAIGKRKTDNLHHAANVARTTLCPDWLVMRSAMSSRVGERLRGPSDGNQTCDSKKT